ncbi:hypothetical protein BDF20DRAFT_861331 [Mycotypha africana]|uniref:uncharacterized protein n=1 Tax=Mycotypha africana TaxID=64632 RepID=UPI0023008824|nr:uncharacterized protein BDF20DRAFT_861331 [Mycotypha africana]KAI8984714.1 hypothetical protein BDF20DRAFT_861331 [Mycotypha africana]
MIVDKSPYRNLSFKIGEQVEAIKFNGDAKEWYCARVVEILNDSHNEDELLVFVHYEGWPPDEADWISPTLIRSIKASKSNQDNEDEESMLRFGPRGRESSRSWKDYAIFYESESGEEARQHTGLVQDRRMTLHCCPCHSRETVHPERPDRITSILQAFHSNRMLRYFKRIHARECTSKELLRVHQYSHVRNYYPLQHDDDDDNNNNNHTVTAIIKNEPPSPPQKPLKITSIAALLNPAPSPTSTTQPSFPTPPSAPYPLRHHSTPTVKQETVNTKPPMVTRGVSGGVVIEADHDHIRKQQRRFSTAAAAADASQSNPQPNTPPALVCKMTCGELGIAVDTTFHPLYSSLSARVAAGALLTLVEPIVKGQMRNGFALIRPPGHHAEDDAAMGFCFYNNVAVAVADTLEKYSATIKRILIIDWDIHHGNGTQKIFYDNPNVLYISIHRWDKGQFYPFSGAPDECGVGAGLGKNVNIALSASEDKPKPMGDTEFVAAFYHFVIPIAKQFQPDMIFVSAGFDAAEGHPENLGGYNVTPRGYAILTKMVKDLAEDLCQGRLVLTLEGGYELQPLAYSCAASVAQLLLPNTLPDHQITTFKRTLNAVKPNMGAVESFKDILNQQKKYWTFSEKVQSPEFRFNLPSDWRATDSISTRPRRDRKTVKTPIVEGY